MARKTQTTSHLAQSRQCGKPQLHKCPKYSACHAPHTTDLHQMLCVPRKTTLSLCPTPATHFLGCHHSTRPDNVEKTRSTTRGTRCACHAKYEDGVQSAEPAAKMQVPFGEPRQGIAPVTQNDSRHFFKQVGMSRSATPATQNTITRFETPTGTPRTRTKTRHAGSSKRAFLTRLPQIPHFVATKSTVPNEPQNLRPENRCSCEGSVTFSTCHKILQHLPRNLNVVVT